MLASLVFLLESFAGVVKTNLRVVGEHLSKSSADVLLLLLLFLFCLLLLT